MGYTKIIQSGSVLEIYQYEKDIVPKRKARKDKGFRRSIKPVARRADNVARLKRNFIRLTRSNLVGTECPAFLTLTLVEVLRIELCYRLLTRFISRLRRLYGLGFRYIAVPEFQKRGAVHFHILIWGLPKEIILNERFTRSIQRIWARGFVDCFLTDGHPKIASYVAKYMQKALFDDRLYHQKAYVCSRNVLRPLSFSSGVSLGFSNEIWGTDLSTATPRREKVFDTQWLGKGRYRIFNLKNNGKENI